MAGTSNAIVRLGLESNQYEKRLKQAQKQWQDFTKAIGMNIGKLTAVGVAAGAVTVSMKVMKDAFFKNEQQLDEWGRTVKSAESLYSGFLNALNNGSISGYLSNINNIVSAARAAYDALDELGTFNAFNQINQEKARTSLTEAMADYREGTGSKEAVQAAGEALKKELLDRQKREQDAYETAVRSIAEERGVNGDQLLRIMGSDYATLQQYKSLGLSGTGYVFQQQGMFGGSTPVKKSVAATEQEKLGEMLRQLNDTEIQSLQALGAQAQRTSTEVANVDKQIALMLRGGTNGTGGTGTGGGAATKETYTPLAGSIDAQTKKVQELQSAFNAAGSEGVRMGLLPQLREAEHTLERMKTNASMWIDPSGIGIPGAEMTQVALPEIDDSAREKAAALAKIAEQNRESWQAAAGAIGQVGQALQMIEDPTLKVAGIIAEAIANIALSFSQAMSQAATAGPWAWLGFAATGAATMISTIASIKQATAGSYADSGVIPGNHHSGDMQWARVNAGEVILNEAHAGIVAHKLQQGSLPNTLHLEAIVSAEALRLVLNNNGRRTMKGEYVTTHMKR